MPESSIFRPGNVVLDARRHSFPEPTLLPHLANSVSAEMLPMLMDTAEEAAAGRGVCPPWPPLVQAVSAAVAKHIEKLPEDAVTSRVLRNNTVIYSHLGESLIDKAVASNAEETRRWQLEERAERLCRLAANHREYDDGVLVELAVAALLDLGPEQRIRPNAWFFKIASPTERRDILESWTRQSFFDIDALMVMFLYANREERQQLTSWLFGQTDHGTPDDRNVIAIAGVLQLLERSARIRAVRMIGPALTTLVQSQPPWWTALVCSKVFSIAPETSVSLSELEPVWQSWIASFSPVLPDAPHAVVLRAHPGSIEWMASPGYPGLAKEDADALLEEISRRWGGVEMAMASPAESSAAPGSQAPVNNGHSQPRTGEQSISPSATAPAPQAPPESHSPNASSGGILGRIGNVFGGLFGGGRSGGNEEESVMRGPASPAQPPLSPRRLQSNVSLSGGQDENSQSTASMLTSGFIAGATHLVQISVGRGASLQVAEGFVEPDNVDDAESTVLAARVVYNNRVSQGEITLPKDTSKNSSIWQTSLVVSKEDQQVEATVVVLHKDRVLQVATITGPVFASASEQDGADDGIEFKVTADVHELADLTERTSFDAAVVTDGKSGAAFAGASIGVRDLKGVDTTIEKMTDRLFKTSEATAILDGGGTPKAFEQLLVFLAAHGKLLHSTLIRQLMPKLDAANRIQIVSTNPSAILPLEFVYAGPSPMANATLCANWQQSLEKGVCTECASLPMNQRSATICPLHFWALSKVVERHAPGQPGQDAHDFRVSTQGPAQRKQLAPLQTAVFAASDNVPEDLVESTLGLLNDSLTHCDEARTWSEWMQTVETRSPSLLVSMPHNALDPLLEISTLEIGSGDALRAGEVTPGLIRRASSEVGPVVLLLGCQTAVGERQPFHTFVGEFRHNGAAVVIGTFSTVLAEHAAPVVQAIVKELSQPSGSETMGDVLLRIRRRMFARGILIALAVAAFGDADWTLAKPQTGGT